MRSRVEHADRLLLIGCALLTAASAGAHAAAARGLASFVVALLALGGLAALVGRAVDRLGDRLGSGLTGVVQAAFGNFPELFFSIFALRAGLVAVVQATIVGSMLGNLLLVLGLAFIAGGARHGTQTFEAEPARNGVALLSLAVAIVVVPTLSAHLALPVAQHERSLSDAAAIVLLLVFVLAVPFSVQAAEVAPTRDAAEGLGVELPSLSHSTWPLGLALAVLGLTSVAAAFVSDWFVAALGPSLVTLHVTQSFAGLVIVAIAGNAVENVVGIQLALRDRMDYALSVILQSPIQIALFLLPLLVLVSYGLGGAPLTLVFPPLDLVALGLGTVVTVIVVFDGRSNWLEGVILVGLYATIAAAFWWG
jgi:Ca2+:H+ antiporter